MKTRAEIDELIARWLDDPDWELEESDGFEDHKDPRLLRFGDLSTRTHELLAVRHKHEAEWKAQTCILRSVCGPRCFCRSSAWSDGLSKTAPAIRRTNSASYLDGSESSSGGAHEGAVDPPALGLVHPARRQGRGESRDPLELPRPGPASRRRESDQG